MGRIAGTAEARQGVTNSSEARFREIFVNVSAPIAVLDAQGQVRGFLKGDGF